MTEADMFRQIEDAFREHASNKISLEYLHTKVRIVVREFTSERRAELEELRDEWAEYGALNPEI